MAPDGIREAATLRAALAQERTKNGLLCARATQTVLESKRIIEESRALLQVGRSVFVARTNK
jgi:hypothetical protein